MTSPLSILRKNRRAPLPDLHTDGERKPHKERSDSDYEEKLFQDIFPQNQPVPRVPDHLSTLRSKFMQKKKAKAAVPSDFELMSSMMQKICHLERKVKTQAVDIEQKARRIAVLEEKLNILREAKVLEESASNENQDEGLVQFCLKLQKQVWEMENFLNDYGMIWVGGYEENQDERAESQLTGASSGRKRFEMNFDLVMQNVKELNLEAGEGESHVTAIPGGAKLTQKPPIPLWLYKNGIVMFNGPFRSYQDPTTQECMQDLMDGFFPSELQERFPNGVPFQVNDRREEEFIVRRPRAEFPGRGQTIDGGQQMMDSSEISSTIPKQSQIAGRKLSMEQFLRKLPETVVKAGKVISIRDSVKAHLLGLSDDAKSRSAIIVETSALQSSRECENDSSKSAKDVSTLRVKSEDGTDTFIIKMYFTETIGDLRQYLDVKRGPSAASYDIISAFPQRRYSDDTQTLLACGLTPNAALLLRAQAPAHRH
ncbi:UBX domain-containing protein 11 isoform X1 [Danio rerio]|uniref:UBX domain-containing protein 11 n=4 Tax=Danio rerio TaxID=7955 RepID=F1R1A5_DANRE|nr:UBX domain-containing protein 11 isoform X1 [Danio rerio]|eukprot:XP_697591.2 UBX domain-containing protein 11 isoform X1 [Danio rerio]